MFCHRTPRQGSGPGISKNFKNLAPQHCKSWRVHEARMFLIGKGENPCADRRLMYVQTLDDERGQSVLPPRLHGFAEL
jgi:hypothetical protein